MMFAINCSFLIVQNETEDSVAFMPFSLFSQSRIKIAEKAFRTFCTKLKSELDNDDFLKNLVCQMCQLNLNKSNIAFISY